MDKTPGKMYALAVLFGTLPVVAVFLRFYVRYEKGARIMWDDWAILVALIKTALGGLGQHMRVEGNHHVYDAKTRWDEKCSTYVIWQSNYPDISYRFHKTLGSPALSADICWAKGWMIAFTFANIFECNPGDTLWDKKPWGSKFDCVKLEDLYISQAYIDVVTDFLIIILPIPIGKLDQQTLVKVSKPLDKENLPVHVKHCFEYIRNHLTCHVDLTLEPFVPALNSSKIWGVKHTCRDFQKVNKWAKMVRNTDSEGIGSIPDINTPK
ncbi:hypothetical protein DM02DRAFT_627214 [Periconia macrospinosa]|uniref:Rhodopsin domain-containing protein n=1 Tax=Periconia macrospinosa TaxID=97972 RepID=A0A2V1DX48_9PLEO|nr:hypothetical protein DM02DRAFT_627214 [Periconia macrospinosa]